ERIPDPEPEERVHRLERVGEEFLAVVDPRQTRPAEKVFPEHPAPELVDGGDFREEAVAAAVEPESLGFDGAGDAADLSVLLDDANTATLREKLMGGRQSGRTRADDDDGSGADVRHAGRCARRGRRTKSR